MITFGVGSEYNEVDLSSREFYTRFAGFRRDSNDPEGLFKFQGQYGENYIGLLEVLAPIEFSGEEVPVSLSFAGIKITEGHVDFKPGKSGFIIFSTACGFSLAALDKNGESFEPDYFRQEWVGRLVAPVTYEQVVLKLVEPKLLQIADAGHVVRVRTTAEKNWAVRDSMYGLPHDEAVKFYRDLQNQPGTNAADKLRQRIKSEVQAGKYTASDVAAQATQVCPTLDVSGGKPILEQLSEAQLRQLLEKLAPGPAL